jgi:hypothetical protein
MKLILFRNGDTDAQPIESTAIKHSDDHDGRALILYLASGDMAVLKLESPAEVAHVIDSLQG